LLRQPECSQCQSAGATIRLPCRYSRPGRVVTLVISGCFSGACRRHSPCHREATLSRGYVAVRRSFAPVPPNEYLGQRRLPCPLSTVEHHRRFAVATARYAVSDLGDGHLRPLFSPPLRGYWPLALGAGREPAISTSLSSSNAADSVLPLHHPGMRKSKGRLPYAVRHPCPAL